MTAFLGLEHPDHRAQQELRDLAPRGSRVQLVGDVGQLAHEAGQELLFGVRLGGLPPRRSELLLGRGQARLEGSKRGLLDGVLAGEEGQSQESPDHERGNDVCPVHGTQGRCNGRAAGIGGAKHAGFSSLARDPPGSLARFRTLPLLVAAEGRPESA